MDWLKEHLGDELYSKVTEKLKDNDKVKLANLASGEYIGKIGRASCRERV